MVLRCSYAYDSMVLRAADPSTAGLQRRTVGPASSRSYAAQTRVASPHLSPVLRRYVPRLRRRPRPSAPLVSHQPHRLQPSTQAGSEPGHPTLTRWRGTRSGACFSSSVSRTTRGGACSPTRRCAPRRRRRLRRPSRAPTRRNTPRAHAVFSTDGGRGARHRVDALGILGAQHLEERLLAAPTPRNTRVRVGP